MRGLLGGGVLNPDTLTIGFARRFATYKRATLLLSQPERLMAMLNDADRPVQFVFAGKAHPADTPGKELIQKIEQFARKAGVRHRFVFLADYDMAIAREMYHGCDVWLNTPRRPLEACGTSGMKAALNGALNCSILDGWWDECYAPGHRLGDRVGRRRPRPGTPRPARVRQPLRRARGAGDPPFYEHTSGGLPRAWVEMVQEAWATLGPRVTAARMVRDYTTASVRAGGRRGTVAVRQCRCSPPPSSPMWRRKVRAAWPSVAITSLDVDTSAADTGAKRPVTVTVAMDGLEPGDLRVDVLHGTVGTDGEFRPEPATVTLHAGGRRHLPRRARAHRPGSLRRHRQGDPGAPGAGARPTSSASPPGPADARPATPSAAVTSLQRNWKKRSE